MKNTLADATWYTKVTAISRLKPTWTPDAIEMKGTRRPSLASIHIFGVTWLSGGAINLLLVLNKELKLKSGNDRQCKGDEVDKIIAQ